MSILDKLKKGIFGAERDGEDAAADAAAQDYGTAESAAIGKKEYCTPRSFCRNTKVQRQILRKRSYAMKTFGSSGSGSVTAARATKTI